MANKAISELPQAQNVNNQDLFVLEQSGIAKKLTAETFITEQGIIDALAEALDGHGGIQSVTLASVSGRIRTYRITFSDGSATTFQVYDGTSIDRISRTSSSGLQDIYTIFMSDGTTSFFTVTNGADGTVSEAMLNDALKGKAPAVTETTESSAIATFTDGADDMPLHNILAEINPVQDLHGYDAPWPAGGGKNLLQTTAQSKTENGVTWTVNADGTITVSGTAEGYTDIEVGLARVDSSMGNITVSGIAGTTNIAWGAVKVQDINSNVLYEIVGGGTQSEAYCDLSQYPDAYYVRASVKRNNNGVVSGTVKIQVEKGSTATTWTPYSNICPISGRTEVRTVRSGVNLFDKTTAIEGRYISDVDGRESLNNGAVCTDFISVLPSTSYYIINPAISGRWGAWYDENKNYISACNGGNIVVTSPSNAHYVRMTIKGNASSVGSIDAFAFNYPSTDHDYHAYQGSNTVTLSWQTEAGTVYGGTIDVATGLLTVDRAMVDMGTMAWGYESSNAQFYSNGIAGTSINWYNWSNTPPLLCSRYKPISNSQLASSDFCVGYAYNSKQLRVKDSTYTDAATFKTAMSGVQLVYELATPQTYLLTPQQLMTLLGTNNVWADTGNVSVTYPTDTKMFIEKLTMPTEDDLVANQAITSGKYFMIGNSIYLALANIASGAAITIGTNAQRVSLADALNAINS